MKDICRIGFIHQNLMQSHRLGLGFSKKIIMKESFERLGISYQENHTESKTIYGLFNIQPISVKADLLNIKESLEQVLSQKYSKLYRLETIEEANDFRKELQNATKADAVAILNRIKMESIETIDIAWGDLMNEFDLGENGLEVYWNLGYNIINEKYYILSLRDASPHNPTVYSWYSDRDYQFRKEGDLKSFLACCFTDYLGGKENT